MTKLVHSAEVLAAFSDNLAELQACTDDSYILAWANGLGVGFTADHKPFACSLTRAESIVTQEQARAMPEDAWAFTPIVVNGAGERASLVTRQGAIAKEIEKVKDLIAQFS